MFMRRSFAIILIVAVFVSGYFGFQSVNVFAQSNFNQSVMAATRLLNIQFLDTSSTALGNGYFTVLLTFENPATQTVNLLEIVAYYYASYAGSPGYVASAISNESARLVPGIDPIILRMNLVLNASFTPPINWNIYYKLGLGSTQYWFNYYTYGSVTSTVGPYGIGGEDPAFTALATYALAVVDAWAVALEIIAALSLFGERKNAETAPVLENKKHGRMFGIMYALQGIGVFAFLPSFYLLESLFPGREVYSSAAGGSTFLFLAVFVWVAGSTLLLTAWGLTHGSRSALYAALVLSSIVAFLSFCGAVSILTAFATMQDLALAVFSLATFAGNLLALYALLKERRQW